jgi:anti-sigma factor RsiW
MTNCLDTGMIQGFLDRELSPAADSDVSAHIAACDACAAQLATAEEESAFVFSVLEREMDSLVPTQRLWNKINDSIEVEKQNAPFWQKAWIYLTAALANPAIAVAAVAVIVFGISTVVFVDRKETGSPPPTDVAKNNESTRSTPVSTAFPESLSSSPVDPKLSAPTQVKAATYAPAKIQNAVYKAPGRATGDQKGPQPVSVPGEENYVKTINTLAKSIDNQKDTVLRPSERNSYERDMAVVNDAIAKLKKEVQKNPKNDSAKQVLYSSYQNKIDLLNSVSQREELVASLK